MHQDPPSRSLLLAGLLLSFIPIACTGSVSNDGSDATGGNGGADVAGNSAGSDSGGQGGAASAADLAFQCDSKASPLDTPLRRLSATQVKNVVNDLIAMALQKPDLAGAAQAEVASALSTWPSDVAPAAGSKTRGLYRRMDLGVVTELVAASYRTAEAVGLALTTDARVGALLGDCAAAADTKPCVLEFLRRVGPRLLRRPLTADDETFYMSKYTAKALDATALAQLIGILFASPDFFYTIESGTENSSPGPGQSALTATELASRLALQLWNTIPDDELWEAATSGKLLEEATYDAQVKRMLADPKALPVIDEFVSDWLLLNDVPRFDSLKQESRYQSFAAADGALLTMTLRQAAIDDVLALARDLFLVNPASPQALMKDTRVFAKDAALARLYGVSVWDGKSDVPRLAERPGLLTRVALLATPTVETHPILRGTFVRVQILGDALPPPPDNANAIAQMEATTIPATASTRERIASITESRPVCASCHLTFINPLGFALEGFDALGRIRTKETVLDGAGKVVATPEINTKTDAQIHADNVSVAGAADLADAIASSGKLEVSLARQYFRFLNRRREVDDRDGCQLESLRKSLMEGKTLRDMLVTAVSQPSFRERVFQ
ncbi:MAG: DUF1592 domain-containing protein [Deltaproteobacteria bacterium]|nr:DUF1592 domain-containing protein [Deltaproteobacteria bacterium]